jgi:hypothetical protein
VQVWYVLLKRSERNPAGHGWDRRRGGKSREEAKERLEAYLTDDEEGLYVYGWIVWDGELKPGPAPSAPDMLRVRGAEARDDG